jgi:hypothetical protein
MPFIVGALGMYVLMKYGIDPIAVIHHAFTTK